MVSPANRCQDCHAEPDWRLERVGDVVVSWACSPHLVAVAELMQRASEVTELSVKSFPRLQERAEINAAIRAALDEAGVRVCCDGCVLTPEHSGNHKSPEGFPWGWNGD